MKEIQRISLAQIDLQDETFSVNFMPELQRLRASIEAIGLVEPVLLRERKEAYQIISGFRRIVVIKELGYSEIESRVVEKERSNDLELFLLSLHQNITARGLNTVEIAIGLDKLIHRFGVDRQKVIQHYLPLFSLETNEKILDTYLALAQMEEEIKAFVIKEKVSRSNIRRLASLEPEDRMALLLLFSSLRLGEARLKEILTLLEEISRRDETRVGGIVGRPEFQALLFQKELTPSQRTERVKNLLMQFRYPRFHQLERRFQEKRRSLDLPPGLSLHHEPYFESKGLKIEFRFETLEEFEALLGSLSLLRNKKAFEELLDRNEEKDSEET